MRYTFIFLTLVIVSLILAPNSAASGVDVSVKDAATMTTITSSNPLSMCPGPITPQRAILFVQNTGAETDTYELNFKSLPTGWESNNDLRDDITLEASEKDSVDPFLINIPSPYSLSPGDYEIVIEAVSLSGGERDEATLYVEMLACYGIDLSSPPSQKICEESPTSTTYTVEVENTGKYPETFALSLSDDWATVSDSEVILGPGKKKTVTVTLDPPQGTTGKQIVKLTAQSTLSYAKAEIDIVLNIEDCFDFSVNLQPSHSEACVGDAGEYTLEINNKGETDTFTITGPENVDFELDKIVDMGTKKGFIAVIVEPETTGTFSFDVQVKSENTGTVETVTSTIDAKECRGIVVILTPSEQETCSTSGDVEFIVTLKNTGTVGETLQLTTTAGTLETDEIFLEAGKSDTVELSVAPDTSKTITVTATSGSVSDSSSSTLQVENCFDAHLLISPAQISMCPCGSVDFEVTLENTGKETDTYEFVYGDKKESITLIPGKDKKASFTVDVDCDAEAGVQEILATAVSENVNLQVSSELNVKPLDACFGLHMENGEGASVEVFQGAIVAVRVKNTGEIVQEIKLSVEGPDWVFISPEKMELESGEEEIVYVYATPPFGTEEDLYTAIISSSSQYTEDEYTVTISVGEDGDVTTVETPEKDDNETIDIPDDGGVNDTTDSNLTLDVTFENITGNIIKETETSSFKTIAIGVITIIIIIILVIRFAILIKK